jgi:hypothetical protein
VSFTLTLANASWVANAQGASIIVTDSRFDLAGLWLISVPDTTLVTEKMIIAIRQFSVLSVAAGQIQIQSWGSKPPNSPVLKFDRIGSV